MNTPAATYKPIPGYPGYRVGDDGSVWTCLERAYTPGRTGSQAVLGTTWRRKRQRPGDSTGHLVVSLRDKAVYVHRLVLLAFVGPCPDGMECRHEDDDPTNNRLTNLTWGTRASNIADRIRNGIQPCGERHVHAKLTDAVVRKLRAEHAAGGVMLSELDRRYGLVPGTAWAVVKRKRWAHVV